MQCVARRAADSELYKHPLVLFMFAKWVKIVNSLNNFLVKQKGI